MKEEIKHIVVGAVKSIAYAGGINVSESVLADMAEVDCWHYVDNTTQIINNASLWCYEFRAPEYDEQHFLQVEIKTEFKTVVGINIITNEEERITTYSK